MLPGFLERQALSARSLLAHAGLAEDSWERPRLVVARAQICSILLEAARRADDPALGLLLGNDADPIRLGLSGRALLAGRTVRESLHAQARHMPSLQGGVRIDIKEVDGTAYWQHWLEDSDPEHARVLNEGVAAFMVAAVRGVSGNSKTPIRVMLPHRPQMPAGRYCDRLQAEIEFARSPCTVIAFDASVLNRSNAVLDTTMLAATQGLDPMMAELPDADFFAFSDGALIENLNRMFDGRSLAGSLSLVEIARALGYAPRTLQRRLGELDTSFEALLDGWRRGCAQRYLAHDNAPVASIARALGYGHPAHFIRAFRRWEGLSPTAYRRRAHAEPGGI